MCVYIDHIDVTKLARNVKLHIFFNSPFLPRKTLYPSHLYCVKTESTSTARKHTE